MTARAVTFRVVDEAGNSLNHVKIAANERPGDNIDICVEKRLAEANSKRGKWASDYFRDETLIVIPCDAQGFPLK